MEWRGVVRGGVQTLSPFLFEKEQPAEQDSGAPHLHSCHRGEGGGMLKVTKFEKTMK